MTDVYSAPTSSLIENTIPYSGKGSLEDGIAGCYNFSIGDILGESWKLVSGKKSTIWLSYLFYVVALIVLRVVMTFALAQLDIHDDKYFKGSFRDNYYLWGHDLFFRILMEIVEMCITLPMAAGLMMLGIKLSADAPVESTEVFQYFDKMLPLLGTTLLKYFITLLGFCCFILPGIYLAVAYSMTTPLVVEKNLSGWDALEASRKTISHNWGSYCVLYFAFGVLAFLSVIPCIIGWVWAMPMGVLLTGVVYRTMFGYSGEVNTTHKSVE